MKFIIITTTSLSLIGISEVLPITLQICQYSFPFWQMNGTNFTFNNGSRFTETNNQCRSDKSYWKMMPLNYFFCLNKCQHNIPPLLVRVFFASDWLDLILQTEKSSLQVMKPLVFFFSDMVEIFFSSKKVFYFIFGTW